MTSLLLPRRPRRGGASYYVIGGHGWGTGYGVVARGHRLASANRAGYLRAVPGKRHLPGWSRFEPCLASEYILRSYRFCFCFAPLIATKAIKREKNDWEVFGDEGKKIVEIVQEIVVGNSSSVILFCIDFTSEWTLSIVLSLSMKRWVCEHLLSLAHLSLS